MWTLGTSGMVGVVAGRWSGLTHQRVLQQSSAGPSCCEWYYLTRRRRCDGIVIAGRAITARRYRVRKHRGAVEDRDAPSGCVLRGLVRREHPESVLFCGQRFAISPGVFIPRRGGPEAAVRAGVEWLNALGCSESKRHRVLDLGTGCG